MALTAHLPSGVLRPPVAVGPLLDEPEPSCWDVVGSGSTIGGTLWHGKIGPLKIVMHGIVLLVMKLVSPVFLGLFHVIMANPCGLSRLQICPLYTTVSETKPSQAVLRDLNIGFQGWFWFRAICRKKTFGPKTVVGRRTVLKHRNLKHKQEGELPKCCWETNC